MAASCEGSQLKTSRLLRALSYLDMDCHLLTLGTFLFVLLLYVVVLVLVFILIVLGVAGVEFSCPFLVAFLRLFLLV